MKQDQWLAGVIGGGFVVVIFVGVAVGIVAGDAGSNFDTREVSGQKIITVDKNISSTVSDFITLGQIQLDYPTKGQFLVSPVQIVGRASKDWFVGNSIGVRLEDESGKEIAKGSVRTSGVEEDELLRFEGSIDFIKSASKSATLILYKLNGKTGAQQTEMKIEYEVK